MEKGEIFGRDIVFYFGALAIYLIVGLTPVYTMFLLAMSRIALAVLLPWGRSSSRCCSSTPANGFRGVARAARNYAFLAILTILVAALMLQVISTAAESAVAAGGASGSPMHCRCARLRRTFLIMRQVPSMAQGMASGIALSGFGAVGNLLRMGMGVGRSGLGKMGEFSRGAFLDQDKSRWDSMTRKAGQRLIGARMAREKRPRQNTLKYG